MNTTTEKGNRMNLLRMREHYLGIGVSFLLHGAVFAVILALSSSVRKLSRPIEIDFGVIEQETPYRIDQPRQIRAASAAEGKSIVVRKHIVEQQRRVEQPQSTQPLPTPTAETAVPVQTLKLVAEIGSRSQNPEILTGLTRQNGLAGNGSKGTADASSSTGSETVDNVSVGSVFGPSFAHREIPIYPFVARRMNKEGKVLLRLTIDELGKLLKVEVIEGADFGFTEAAIEAVKQSTYRPAKKNGRAVISRAILPVSFELTK